MKLYHAAVLCFILFACNASAQNKKPSQAEIDVYTQDILRIENYLNNITTLISAFTQIDSNGEKAEGTFYLSRPGKLRWEYYPPSPILIIARNSRLTYYDSELDQVSHIGLDDGLSGFLTRKTISFSNKDIQIISFNKADGEIAITIAQINKEDEGQLTLVFSDKKNHIKKMEVLDAIGRTTIVSFNTNIYGKKLDKKLFTLTKSQRKRK